MQPADGSPTGSAQQIDGNLIALQMIQATNSAAEAAQAAVKAVESMKTGSDDKNWYRSLPKPGDFNPTTREDEISKWREWSWQFEQYLGSLDHHYVSDILDLRKNPTHVVDDSEQSSEEQRRSIFMYGLMAALLKGRPLLMLKAVKNFNGYEGYRQLVLSNEPKSQNRSMSLLNVIMTWPQFSPKTSMISQVMKLEQAFAEYEKLGDILPETIRSAVLLRCLTGQLKTWMQLQLGESTKYSEIREGVLSYERSTTKWSESMVLGDVPDTSAPMEVDRLQWNPKGKEKGKGKFGGKGPKGKGFKGKDSKGFEKGKKGGKFGLKGKHSSKGKNSFGGFGKSGKGAGTNNANQTVTCFNCGKVGHKADNCWQPKKVRNVEQQQHDAQFSCGAPSNQQFGSSASGSAYAGSSNTAYNNQQQQQSSSSGASQSVRRVAMGEEDVFLFDICSNVAVPDALVRMISSCDNSCMCEQFFIGDSDSDGLSHEHCTFQSVYSCDVDWTSACNGSEAEKIFTLYERCEFAAVCPRSFSDTAWTPVAYRMKREPQTVRAIVQDGLSTTIVIDSGSDATVVPVAYANCGLPVQERGSIQDCQGNQIPTSGMREFHFVLQDVNGRTIVLKDYGFLSEQVSGPLISYGHLFRNGWDICRRDDDRPMLRHSATGVCLAMDFRSDSFVVEATIRQVSAVGDVRAIKVDIPELWSQAQSGWQETARGFPIARTNGNFYVDPIDRYSFEDYPYRTTLSFNGRHWEQVEKCRPLATMENRCLPLNSMGAVTILTWSVLSADEIGYILCTDQSQRSSQFLYPAAAPASSSATSAVPQQEAVGDVGMPEPQAVPEGNPEIVAVPNPALDSQPAPVTPTDRLAPQQGPPVLPQGDVAGLQRDSVIVDGVVLMADSTIASLRAACKHVGISQSGSRSKLFRRLVSHFEQKQLEVIYATHPALPVVQPRPQILAAPPADFETISRHELTHLPYEPWCAVCVANKGRQESHGTNPMRQTERAVSVVSFDLSYTGKEAVDGLPRLVEAQADWEEKLVVLNGFDGKSGSVFALPVQKKSDSHFMTRELCKFVLQLGYSEVELRFDNEGAMLQLQRLVQKCLKNGLKVTVTTSRVGDHGDNAWVEQTVHRVRQHAMVILQGVEEKIGHRIPISHPLASWAFKHAAWILNCYCPRNGITPFEAVHGRQFTGRTCPFGEVVMSFVGVENKQKGTAKWMPIMFLGKTSNDMYILARGSSVRLSKSIKRIFPEWFRHIDLYRSFEVHSWMIEGTLGTRIKLSPLKHPGRAAIEAGGDQGSDEAGSDPESIEGLGVDLSDDTPLLFLKHEVSTTPEEAEQVQTSVVDPGMVVDEANAGVDEPPMKRLKVGQVSMVHVDEVDVFHDNEIDVSMFERDDVGYQQGGDDDSLHFETPAGLDDSILWLPFTEEEPELSHDVLAEMDALADKFEVDRLLTMGVLERSTGHEDSSNYGSSLTGKFVRTFRKKERDGQLCWYRRSRLVAREYNYLSVREDTFSPLLRMQWLQE